ARPPSVLHHGLRVAGSFVTVMSISYAHLNSRQCSNIRSRVRCSARAGDRAPTSSTRFVGAIEHRRDKGPLDGTSRLGSPALPRDRTEEATVLAAPPPQVQRPSIPTAWP